MNENLVKSVEILTGAMGKARAEYDRAVDGGEHNLADDYAHQMCTFSKAITEAVNAEAHESLDAIMTGLAKQLGEIRASDEKGALGIGTL